jgi:dipeptidyl aminopeptidase/acylaminoacyl peptidase
VSLAPVTDWRSFHFTSNLGRFDELLLSSDPRDTAGAHASRSPLTHAHRSATPTLLIHGELDRCTPPTQSEQFYNALAEAGVETELVVYPREGHGWRERAHQVDVWRRIGDWFDRHMD